MCWPKSAAAWACITLNRPRALNALSLPMIRALAAALLAWREDPQVQAVAIRGMGKEGPFGAFCAGGDIRFFHQAMLRGDAELEDFFTEEYALNHLIHHYPKPYIAFMDGIVMGGGMGMSQGAKLRIVTPRTKMAMPETNIGLFPDVGGGWFLARCPAHGGEWLALTSEVIGAGDALALQLADTCFDPARLGEAWEALAALPEFRRGQACKHGSRATRPPRRPPPSAGHHCALLRTAGRAAHRAGAGARAGRVGCGHREGLAHALAADAGGDAGADPPRRRHVAGR